MNNKLARIKTSRSGSVEAISQHRVEGMRTQRKSSVMVSSAQAETRTGHLSKTSLQRYLLCRFGEVRYVNISVSERIHSLIPQNIYRKVFQDWTPVYLIGR